MTTLSEMAVIPAIVMMTIATGVNSTFGTSFSGSALGSLFKLAILVFSWLCWYYSVVLLLHDYSGRPGMASTTTAAAEAPSVVYSHYLVDYLDKSGGRAISAPNERPGEPPTTPL